MKNIRYMQRALELATQAQSQDEVPIGCIIVNPDNDEIIAETYNLSQHVEDATAHAEITAIRSACQKLGQNRLRGLDMYVTLEPCVMCCGAIINARIEKVYFGARDLKAGSLGGLFNLMDQRGFNHYFEHEYLENNECSQILKDYFKKKRSK